jgi:hypothetical protein
MTFSPQQLKDRANVRQHLFAQSKASDLSSRKGQNKYAMPTIKMLDAARNRI